MPEKSDTGNADPGAAAEVMFKCKFCGKTKPLGELVVIRRFYPQMTACKDCAKETRKNVKPV
jgi:ribosome-binding protein aMBF1 (putative translation factor)